MLGSNQRPPPCRDGALPAELIARRPERSAPKALRACVVSIGAAMEFELPDGNTLILARRAPPAPTRGGDRARPRAGRAGRQGRRRAARPGAPAAERQAGRAKLEIVTERSGEEALELIRHDAAHVLATAVMELYPGVKISIGPPIEDGFYYDFDFPEGVHVERRRLRADRGADARAHRGRRAVRARGRARRTGARALQSRGPGLQGGADRGSRRSDQGAETVSLYTNGPFTDLCRGPHAPSTKRIKAFKLQSVAGAYWRGDAHNPMLTRVYGTAFFSRRDLESTWSDSSRRGPATTASSGRELGLFMFSELAPGSAVLAAPRDGDLERAGRAVARGERRPRLPRGEDADPLRRRAVEDIGPLGQVPRPHVLHRGRGADRWGSSR